MSTDSFTAHDSDGNTYEILVIRGRQIDASDLNSRTREKKGGLIGLRTLDGLPVFRIAKGRYQIDKGNKTKIIVESTDPNAY